MARRRATPAHLYSDRFTGVSLGSPPPRPGVGRRRLLLGGTGLVALAAVPGCSWLDREPETPSPQEHPDHDLLSGAYARESAVVAAVQATAQRHAGLAPSLSPVAARAQERVTALEEALGTGGAPSPAPEASPPTATAAVPARPAAALRALVTVSQTAQRDHAADCVRASDPGVARLLASVAAGDGQDAVILRTTRSAT